MKKKIFKRIQLIFKKPKDGKEFTDEWINKNIIFHIKDNCPEIEAKGKYGGVMTQKAPCEFCGNKHNIRDDICDIKTKNFKKDGNTMEASTKITLQDLYDQIIYKRDLKFEVMINTDTNANYKALSSNYKLVEERAKSK